MQEAKIKEKVENTEVDFNGYEEEHNAIGFFSVLLRVDKRLHPDKYKPINKNKHA